MDRVELYFLGNITPEYIAANIDSLCFTWIDTLGFSRKFRILKDKIQIDSTSSRRIFYDLPQPLDIQANLTELNSTLFSSVYGRVVLYHHSTEESITQYDSTEIQMNDGMAPVIKEVSLKSTQGKGIDTLTVTFTEKVQETQEGSSLFEFKSSKDSIIREVIHTTLQWNPAQTQVTLTLGKEISSGQRIAPRDSIRLCAFAIKDNALNKALENTPFHFVSGTYPFVTYVNTNAQFTVDDSLKNLPIFQLLFAPFESNVPGQSEMGVAIDIGGLELENSIKRTLRERRASQVEGLSLNEIVINPEKLSFSLDLQIFSNQGAYVASTHSNIKCSDSRFSDLATDKGSCLINSKRLFLRWNFMSVDHRIVGTGAYVVKALVVIAYDGLVIFRNDQATGDVMHSWGVFRR
jgi:hypothetical protein